MTLKLLLAALVAAAVGVGLLLPGPRLFQADARSQIDTLEVGRD